MSTKHTPGPWSCHAHFEPPRVMNGDDITVASVPVWADARLIAAAPKLLSLVQQFIAADAGFDIQRNASDLREIKAEARALLAEIEGP